MASWSAFEQFMIEHVFGPLGAFLKPLLQIALQQEMAAVMPIAMAAVAQVAADPSLLSGGAKRDAALKIIGQQMQAASIQAAASTVNLVLELAVTKLKSQEK